MSTAVTDEPVEIATDENHQGGALSPEEGDREVSILGDKNVLMMRNHGPMVVGATIASAFDRLYYLEEVCKRQVLAMSTNRPLQLVPLEVSGSSGRERSVAGLSTVVYGPGRVPHVRTTCPPVPACRGAYMGRKWIFAMLLL
jgi:ribulose-5-phosphate 4-epimerase/fuculose-1-phosphate aldolase